MRHIIREYMRLLRAIWFGLTAPHVARLLSVTWAMILVAALLFRWLEGWGLLDSVYFVCMTMATVGFGDFAPVTPLGKIASIGFVTVGTGMFVLCVGALAEAVLGELKKSGSPADQLAPAGIGRSPLL